jgi:broad specificity phosphatase PhoE
MPPSPIWLIRHAESIWNASGRWQGQADPPLSPEGHQQAKLLAARLAALSPAALYASDLRRCVETAAAITAATGLEPNFRLELRETDIGRWSGLTTEEIQTTYPDEWSRMMSGQDFARGGGETAAQLLERVAAFATELAANHDGAPVAVITHGGWIRHAIHHYLGHPPEWTRRGFSNTSLTELTATPTGYTLTTLADTTHLTPPESSTPSQPTPTHHPPNPTPLRPAPATGYTPPTQGL